MSTPHTALPVLRHPHGDDASRWDAFIVREQARTYAGLVPADFEEQGLRRAADQVEVRRQQFDQPGTTVRWIAEIDGEIVGAAEASDAPAAWEVELGLSDAPAGRELSRLYLAASAQGSGLAGRMLDLVLGEAAAYLWIIDGNLRAERFYRRHGFEVHGPSVSTGESWGSIPMHRMLRKRA